jgi:hypothetical protein
MPGAKRSAVVHIGRPYLRLRNRAERHGDDETAVEDARGAREGEQLARLALELIPVHDHQHQLGADERGDDQVDPEVHHARAVQSPSARANDGELQRDEVGGRQQHAVRIDRPAGDLKQYGMHVVSRRAAR